MINVLFVDDEPNLLEGMKRVLRGQRGVWQMAFLCNAPAAIELLEKERFDVVVTDMRMPGMNGASLLKEVIERDPTVIRFVLSGQSEQHFVLESVSITHQFFSKPCDIGELVHAITRSCELRRLLRSQRLLEVLSKLTNLPSSPQTFARVLQLLDSEQSSPADFIAAAATDPAMTAKLLQLANFPFFRIQRNITSVDGAVNMLGLQLIRPFVLVAGIYDRFGDEECVRFEIEAQIRHANAVASSAQTIAARLSFNEAQQTAAFSAGLLHDIGKMIIVKELPQEAALLRRAQTNDPLKAEADAVGANHAEIAAFVLGLWGLPDAICDAVEHHHSPLAKRETTPSVRTCVYLANYKQNIAEGKPVSEEEHEACSEYMASLGLPPNFLD